ncbi:MAG: M56 family metallopeptidase [Planctomycetes bacterium]|nr:M56 family metallopeptidase [Planctomycetota bacterium]
MNPLLQIAWSNAFVATALALLVFPLVRVCRKPALAHCLWILVLVKLVTPPILSVPLPTSWVPGSRPAVVGTELPARPVELPAGTAPTEDRRPVAPTVMVGAAVQNAGEQTQSTRLPADVRMCAARVRASDFLPLLAGVWLTGTLWVLTVTGVRIFQFQRALRAATAAPVFLQVEVEALAKRLGVRRRPRALVAPGTISPMLWAPLGGATVLFPAKLLERLGAEARQTLLLHEVAHLRRRDHWVRILESAATAFYWWHPVVWWARREIQLAEEACCDSWVVSEMPDRRDTYAAALVEAVRFLSRPRSVLPLPASGSSFVAMKERVTTIMLADAPKRLSLLGWILVTALAAACLPLLLCPV